ncbi:hypothetical protein [Aquimarina aggregata]|uniref:hypothetical protein n=1 Tax=Aquimarina aggregata TaxID=1642818 RepID=UPI0024907F07|nr:hypothetical protein [Aquimarina aggregata]
MEYVNLAGIVLGSTVITEALKYFLQYRTQKKLKHAQIENLNVQANDVVISNLLKWSEKMEQRIDELEKDNLAMKKDNREMKVIITKQRERINDLEVYTEKLEYKLKKHQEKK